MIRTYSELIQYNTFEDRFNYLALKGSVAAQTFGHERYLNQDFYRSRAWKQVRRDVIARDLGCDLGLEGFEIHDKIIVHHMNPMSADNIIHGDQDILNMEYLISVTHKTHNGIHYGDDSVIPKPYVERRPGDTRLW
ncbi:HNH endonuclease [Arthrobacter phage GoCrazy]|uniref:HNH endonuclease n=7 Tax=Mudcatvirus TaxID=1982088 RepID=A0A222ZIK1_9CAUD|nr:HNH endonuclease [Arthrobacter phage Tribby]YP_010666191.1 HNH endonuclease [Arthrobacter phage Cheesy]YP_010666292.1 HNH endonuclease [Arthrobacter phage Correa]YP_010666387.1 HNH endonuclease [Arthrobacter phage Xenomorph]YP_010666583.1 HNH endonuclease [Arthrobacter phage JEGGS]YP_010666682.1 HNH endonuclease [Arthrobacter phage Kardesai]YP_010666881.1 HNH endonuclease [Arthrobacter phage KeaneyLin]QXO13502.1 HNH endonuclease [Arthrobacter phage GoCrazy]UYL87267.1 HNH endonuclease [Ar